MSRGVRVCLELDSVGFLCVPAAVYQRATGVSHASEGDGAGEGRAADDVLMGGGVKLIY